MKYDFHLLFLLIGIGIFTKKLDWKGWLGLSVIVGGWILFNWTKS